MTKFTCTHCLRSFDEPEVVGIKVGNEIKIYCYPDGYNVQLDRVDKLELTIERLLGY